MSEFHDAFTAARLKAERTYRAIGAEVGLSIGRLCDIERGRTFPPDADTMAKIETALNVTDGHLSRLAEAERQQMPSNESTKLQQALAVANKEINRLKEYELVCKSDLYPIYEVSQQIGDVLWKHLGIIVAGLPHKESLKEVVPLLIELAECRKAQVENLQRALAVARAGLEHYAWPLQWMEVDTPADTPGFRWYVGEGDYASDKNGYARAQAAIQEIDAIIGGENGSS